MAKKERENLYLVGIGPGDERLLTKEAVEIIAQADVLVGGRRQLGVWAKDDQRQLIIDGSLDKLCQEIKAIEPERQIVVLASGDTGIFSIAAYLENHLEDFALQFFPGISSLQYLSAKTHLAWNDMNIVSLHGQEGINIANEVFCHAKTAFFTDKKYHPAFIAAHLASFGRGDLTMIVGENLSLADEQITYGQPAQLAKEQFSHLAIVLVINPGLREGLWSYRSGGIPDELFQRGGVPMTKSEVRAVVISKLRLRENHSLVDIGAGTGSVTVEVASQAYRGKVYGVEFNEEACSLIKINAQRFALDNIEVICGKAPQALVGLPWVDRVFVGGSGGNMEEILAYYSQNPLDFRIVITAIALESAAEALAALEKLAYEDIELVQVAVNRGKKAGGKQLLMAQNPIFIISAAKPGV